MRLSILSLAVLLGLFCPALAAQEVVTGEGGEKIILYPDGTWRPFDPENKNGGQGMFRPSEETLTKNLAEQQEAEVERKQLSLRLIRKRLEVAELEVALAKLKSQEKLEPQALATAEEKLRVAQGQEASLADAVDHAKRWSV